MSLPPEPSLQPLQTHLRFYRKIEAIEHHVTPAIVQCLYLGMASLFQLWNVMMFLSPRMLSWSVPMLLLENSPTSPHVPFNATRALDCTAHLNSSAHPRESGPRKSPPAKVTLSSDSPDTHWLSGFVVWFSWLPLLTYPLQWSNVQALTFQERWTWAAAGQQFLAQCVNSYVLMVGHSMDLQFWHAMPRDTGLGCCLPVKVRHWWMIDASGRRKKSCYIAKEANCPLCTNQNDRL